MRDGDSEVSGAGIATWAERVLSGDAVEVVVTDVASDGVGCRGTRRVAAGRAASGAS
ncbi:hypothetical protein [Agromyces bauzanensis]|uniref:TRAM domain-containing protein n=1 Tax=Agromyces bauzanensis TaxID=1308924 RepID=A0A917PHZ2_9MICO|nr:hypothetical protein [Agromyces bauzanensis]GGJ79036.1 hypothetical protein GCM10011372_16750 [Agromyces bauzanensis]